MQRQVKANKKPVMFILLTLFAVLICVSSASAASTVYVNTTGSDSNLGTIDSPYLTIDKGVQSIDENGNITIADGVYSGTGNTQININRNMTLQGQSQTNTIINGSNTNWIFSIYGGTVTIQNLTFVNASGSFGGVIYTDAITTVNDCTFKGNNADSGAGGALANDGTLNVNRCTFTGNTAYEGGAFYQCDGTATITNSTFTGNTATSQGGAIWIDDETTTTITNCTFTNNTATYQGGAICSPQGSTVSFNLTNSTIQDNKVLNDGFGGGLYLGPYYQYSYEIIGNHILNNVGSGIYILRNYEESSSNKLLINFNRIYGNTPYGVYYNDTVEAAPNVNATLNWWGNNNGPNSVGADKTNLVSTYYAPWIVMGFSPTLTIINGGQTTEILANFLYDNLGTYLDPAKGHIPDGTPVTFTTNLGQVGSQTIIKYTINGIATATLRAWNAAGEPVSGTALLTATTDGQTFSRSVNILPVANAATTTSTSTSTSVQAANTVGMQTTGAPLAPLAIAVFSVLGGLIATRRKIE